MQQLRSTKGAEQHAAACDAALRHLRISPRWQRATDVADTLDLRLVEAETALSHLVDAHLAARFMSATSREFTDARVPVIDPTQVELLIAAWLLLHCSGGTFSAGRSPEFQRGFALTLRYKLLSPHQPLEYPLNPFAEAGNAAADAWAFGRFRAETLAETIFVMPMPQAFIASLIRAARAKQPSHQELHTHG